MNQSRAPAFCFDAFSLGEPASASVENNQLSASGGIGSKALQRCESP
jgi:hypothetical protein